MMRILYVSHWRRFNDSVSISLLWILYVLIWCSGSVCAFAQRGSRQNIMFFAHVIKILSTHTILGPCLFIRENTMNGAFDARNWWKILLQNIFRWDVRMLQSKADIAQQWKVPLVRYPCESHRCVCAIEISDSTWPENVIRQFKQISINTLISAVSGHASRLTIAYVYAN